MSLRTAKYQEKSQIQHVLDRPDTYVGSKRFKISDEYVSVDHDNIDNISIQKRTISFSPALLRIFIEILSNAIDNHKRSVNTNNPCKKIKIDIETETNKITIWNDGDYIPIEKKINTITNTEEYIHTSMFGIMHTSSNYNDDEERDVSGRNGLGSKATNILSSYFSVKGCDPELGLEFEQIWTKNMKIPSKPSVKKSKRKSGYTEVSWIPDFEWFGIKGYTEDILSLYYKYVIDAAMITGVSVYLNSIVIPVKNLKDYVKLYQNNTEESLYIKDKESEIILTPYNTFESISFVNGVYTSRGGLHVDEWTEELFRPIVKKINKLDKPQLKIKDVKNFFRIFVNATVKNPEFDSQEKHCLTSPPIKVTVSQTNIKALLKWNVIDDIKHMITSKELLTLKKASKTTRGYQKIDGLDNANFAGTKKSNECILVICEGKSAKSYVVSGMNIGAYEKKGRNYFGIYPVRGKMLNVKNTKIAAIAKNKIVTDIISALGAKYDVDYTIESNYNTLRYGKVMYIVDQDVDGHHIGSLGLNKFQTLFPSLLKRKESFIVKMETPIAKVFTKIPKVFFDEREYNDFMLQTNHKYKAKYYKGLGTSSAKEVADTFGLKITEFQYDENTDQNMDKVFLKTMADDRKSWIDSYDSESYKKFLNNNNISQLTISQYLNNYTILFSIADNKRSIPHLIDGLKEGQRKILYACFKKKLYNNTIKVAQLSGYVSEHTNYHHGEESLNGTIINMASCYVGGNNLPLLTRDGFFGSRMEMGADTSKPRYIFTKLEKITRLLFREEDDKLLKRVIDDGDIVEPEYYIPIIPFILINGQKGIGTGWSCNMPSYNPLDVCKMVKEWINEDDYSNISAWYRGFTGEIEYDPKGKRYITYGRCDRINDTKVRITELPIGLATDSFKEKLEKMLEEKLIKKMSNHSNDVKIHFDINENPDKFLCDRKSLKMYSYISTNNMSLWNEKDEIKRFNKVSEIINYFCEIRLNLYKERKSRQLKEFKIVLRYLSNKIKFIEEVIKGTIVVFRKKKSILEKELEEKNYYKDLDTKYNYLIKLPVSIFTEEELESLNEEYLNVKNKIHKLKNTSECDIWLKELEEFEKEYQKMLNSDDN